MVRDLLLTFASFALGVYGSWSIRRDALRGRVFSGAFSSFGKDAQPRRYWAAMGFNILAVVLVLGSAAYYAARVIVHLVVST